MLSQNQNNHILVKDNGIEYYTFDGVKVIQDELIRLYRIIFDICEKKGLRHWVTGGTLIGVFRHQGFIPWDDDFDIHIMKKDYIVLNEELTNYSRINKDCCLFFEHPQKYHSTNCFASTQVFTRTEGSKFPVPVKIDICPENCVSEKDVEIDNKYRDIANRIIYNKSYGYISDEEFKRINITDFFSFFNSTYGIDEKEGENQYLNRPYFEYDSRKLKKTFSDIFPLRQGKFGEIKVPIPQKAEYILESLYGNYMGYPTLDNRAPVASEVIYTKSKENTCKRYIKLNFTKNDSIRFYKLKLACCLLKIMGVRRLLSSLYNENKTSIKQSISEDIR